MIKARYFKQVIMLCVSMPVVFTAAQIQPMLVPELQRMRPVPNFAQSLPWVCLRSIFPQR